MSAANSLIKEIVHLHEENIGAAKATAERAIEIGVKLHQLKQSVPHGEFLPLLAKEAKKLSESTCGRYMRIASERLIEEKCFQLLEEQNPAVVKSVTVTDLKPATGGDSPVVREEQFIPAEVREQAEQQLDKVDWMKLPVTVKQLVKGLNNRELTDLYRDYGVIRGNQAKVHHAPKPMTVEEQLEAEKASAMAPVVSLHNACADVCMDLESKGGIIAVRVDTKELKILRRQLARTSKLILGAIKLKSKGAKPSSKAVAKARKA